MLELLNMRVFEEVDKGLKFKWTYEVQVHFNQNKDIYENSQSN